jgi:hypothetical protein
MKFVRRKELETGIRLEIVILALSCQGVYGARTALAYQYNISRSFLYQLIGIALFCLQEVLSIENISSLPTPLDPDSMIVLLRLEAKASISNISEILQAQNYPHYSTGMTSERLTYLGEHLPNTLNIEQEQSIFYLSDEIFALGSPILITIEPVSTAILRIELAPNRKADTWQQHFEALSEQQFIVSGLGSDRGKGLVQGFQSAHEDLLWCSDHFHEFRGLIQLRISLEKQAYAAIATEEECQRLFNNARSEGNLEKRMQRLLLATADCEQKITEYQQVSDILDLLFPSLYFFDLETRQPHYQQQVKDDVLTLMDLLDELSLPKLQVQTQKIREHINDICVCYQQVEDVYQQLSQTIPLEPLNAIGVAWQHEHQSHQLKGVAKKYHLAERDFWLQVARSFLGENADIQITQAFEQFNAMVRAASLIEMVNSQIRPFLNSCKGKITQAHLNLIMFYHNHHLYKSGRRKGQAPIELLTGRKLEKHWLPLLFETVSLAQ